MLLHLAALAITQQKIRKMHRYHVKTGTKRYISIACIDRLVDPHLCCCELLMMAGMMTCVVLPHVHTFLIEKCFGEG